MKCTWIPLPVGFFSEYKKRGGGVTFFPQAVCNVLFSLVQTFGCLMETERQKPFPPTLYLLSYQQQNGDLLLSQQPPWTHVKHLPFARIAAIENKTEAGNRMAK